MGTRYFKRYRMEIDLRQPPSAAAGPHLPPGFYWLPWADGLLDAHVEVKALSFQNELDAVVFPCLASVIGCRELMLAIRRRPGFCPGATWLVASDAARRACPGGLAADCVATVQGVVDDNGCGAIQNVGVLPEFRGRGLGRALLLKALAGFAAAGARRGFLEVTARNEPAVRMYRGLGFRTTQTLYRSVDAPEPIGEGL